ncbi:MAG: phenylalanine--tRNA ligase alpha subunit [Phycisphaeraceae bacterium]|nr:MAG: phenylalanine--tRNA ligase alpha subunit [Phycisphaeraceae bacterium]
MLDALTEIETSGLAELGATSDADALEAWRIAYLGTKGRLRAVMPMMKDVPKDQKGAVGKRLNEVKSKLESAFEAKQSGSAGKGPDGPAIDMTEPGVIDTHAVGRRHILSRVREELVEVFARMGFGVAQGPELEDDEHNFVKLNIPADHPARDPIDNFYVDDPATTAVPRMLRSQTSTVQIRTLEDAVAKGWGPPVKVVSPGRVYRPDTVDATHSFMFHQIEGLHIDRGVSMADLKTTLFQFARAYFGDDAEVRLRPSFFPFTEPSAEFDMKIALRPGDEPAWIELGGCGMVDPNVLKACGLDPDEWSGFAFGFGIERLAMGKYAIPDIRMLFENDVRFLTQV